MKSGYFAPIVSEELMEEMNKTFRYVCKTCKISIKEAIELCGYRRQSFYKALKTKKFPRALFLAMMEGMFVIIDIHHPLNYCSTYVAWGKKIEMIADCEVLYRHFLSEIKSNMS